MNLHINIDTFSGHLSSALDLDSYKKKTGTDFVPAPKNFNMEQENVSITKPLFDKIKGTIGLGEHSPIVITPEAFFSAEFEPIEGKIYLAIENDSLKELTVNTK